MNTQKPRRKRRARKIKPLSEDDKILMAAILQAATSVFLNILNIHLPDKVKELDIKDEFPEIIDG